MNKKEKKHRLIIQMSQEERKDLEKLANKENRSMGNYIRCIIAKEIKKINNE
jgi:predicted DNA-binding protein